MAKVEMKAKVTFYNAGVFTSAGDTFHVEKEDVAAYVTRGLADPIHTKAGNQADAVAGEKQYENMTVTELRSVAKASNVTGYYQMSKAELIDAIRQQEINEAEGVPAVEPAEMTTEGAEE